MAKRMYRKGMTLFHNDTHEKILFGKWNEDGTGACIGPKNSFLNIPKDELNEKYVSETELNQAAKKRRSGQAW